MRKSIFFFWSIILPVLCSAQHYNKEVEAVIDLEVINTNMLQISGTAHNKTEINKSLRYVLSVIKTDKYSESKSKNDQEGRFVLEPGIKKSLSTTTINVDDENRTIILLLVYEDDEIVGKDRKVLNGLEGEEDVVKKGEKSADNQDVKKSEEDGFILKGMVIEDTKTKAGNDFYDLFYSSYLARNINGEKIVQIEEKLAIANNTQIKVVIEDDIVMQFIVNPRSQYLNAMAERAVNRVNMYFQRLRNTKDQIIRY